MKSDGRDRPYTLLTHPNTIWVDMDADPNMIIDDMAEELCRDSKQLSENKRVEVYDQLMKSSSIIGLGVVSHRVIDRVREGPCAAHPEVAPARAVRTWSPSQVFRRDSHRNASAGLHGAFCTRGRH